MADVTTRNVPSRPSDATGETGMPSVLHVVHTTQRRGAEIFGVDLATALSSRVRRSWVVALVDHDGSPHRLPVEALGPRSLGSRALRRLRSVAREADVVVAHGSRTLPACAIALASSDIPFVYRSIGDPAAWSGTGLRLRRTALLLRRAARVVTFWRGAADTLALTHGVPTAKLRVIPKGVPAPSEVLGDSLRAMTRAELGLPIDAPVVASIGALSPEKRVHALVDAVARLPAAHLLVAGDGPERPAIEARAEHLAPGRVRCVGSLPGPQRALAAADVVALASRTEGMPGALIEAGLACRPVVATAVGGVAEIVEDGVTGRLVPAGDDAALAEALRTTLADPGRAAAMGVAARDRCLRRFDLAAVAGRWADLLTSVAMHPDG